MKKAKTMPWLLCAVSLLLLCVIAGCAAPAEPDGPENSGAPEPPPVEAQEPEAIALGGNTFPLDAEEVYLETNGQEAFFQGLSDLPAFSAARSVRVAFLGGELEENVDLTALGEMPALESLTVSIPGDSGCLEGLAACSELKELHLNGFRDLSLPPLEVEELYISQSKAVGWSTLEAMPELTYLYVSETDSLPGFGILARCETLRKIHFVLGTAQWEALGGAPEDLERLTEALTLTGEGELPDWLPFPAEELAAFLSRPGAEVVLHRDHMV